MGTDTTTRKPNRTLEGLKAIFNHAAKQVRPDTITKCWLASKPYELRRTYDKQLMKDTYQWHDCEGKPVSNVYHHHDLASIEFGAWAVPSSTQTTIAAYATSLLETPRASGAPMAGPQDRNQ